MLSVEQLFVGFYLKVQGIKIVPETDLQEGSSRVATGGVSAHFVNFVKQQQRVAHSGAAQRLDDAPRHGTYVGTPVAAHLRLVPHASQADALERPSQDLPDIQCP